MESSSRKAVYEFGDIVLDTEGRKLSVSGEEVHLPAKEFETLLLLVEHNGKALTKEEMMSALWQNAYVEEGNLAKQISRLRKVLNSNGNQYIETLPKHGYRFSADMSLKDFPPEESIVLERHTVKSLTLEIENDTSKQLSSSLLTFPRIAAVAAIALVAAATVWFWIRASPATLTKIDSIAVMPLRPLNNDEDTKALGLGLADALITKLGSTRRVVVRPTNAVAPFTGDSDPIESARRLNVDAVLEGTIQQADGRLRVNVRLIRAATGEQIWAERFEQPAAGIFALQDALSANIAKALAFELTKSDSDQFLKRGTANAEAYEKYLRGRFYQTQNTPDGLNRSIEIYEQAIALDPNFAEAYAGIADSNVILFNFGIRPAAESIPKARQALARALHLDPELPNAYTSLALIQFLSDRSWPDAEKSLQHAIEIDPNSADAYHRYGYFLMRVGRFDDAHEKYLKARELNPLSNIVQSGIGLTYLCARRYPEAIEQLEKTAADNPQFAHALWLLGTSYEAAGDGEKAFETNLKALGIEGGGDLAENLRKVKEFDGLDAANRLWLRETIKASETGHIPPLLVAMRAATVKDRERTLTWLERSLEAGDTTLGGIKYLSKFDFVRDDPRFQAVVENLAF